MLGRGNQFYYVSQDYIFFGSFFQERVSWNLKTNQAKAQGPTAQPGGDSCFQAGLVLVGWIQRVRVNTIRLARFVLILIITSSIQTFQKMLKFVQVWGRGNFYHFEKTKNISLVTFYEGRKMSDFECVKNERKSKVWQFFLLNKAERKAKCISCFHILIMRKDGSTCQLQNHLRSKHFMDYKLTKSNKNENTKGQ